MMDLLMDVAEGVAVFAYHLPWAVVATLTPIVLTVAVVMALFLGVGLVAEALLYVFDPKSREFSRQIRATNAKK